MLKIKDNVDLNILIEKYGFKPRYDVDTGEIIELYRINGHYSDEKELRRMLSNENMFSCHIFLTKDELEFETEIKMEE